MVGSIRLPSSAVVAMVEPEIAENTVPATMAMTDSRAGTRRISSAKASIALSATPVWNSTSPISTKNGIGVSEKLVIDCTALRASCDEARLAAEEEQGADHVEQQEREGDRQAEPHHRDQAAEQQQAPLDPAHAVSSPTWLRCGASRAPLSRRSKRNTNSIASSTNVAGSGASSHHSGNTRFLMVMAPSRQLS